MAGIAQVLLPLICVVLAEAHFPLPFIHFGLGDLPHPNDDLPIHKDIDYEDHRYGPWFHHFGNPDEHRFSSESDERDKPFDDSYFHSDSWEHMPAINNEFNIPNGGYNSHRHQPTHRGNNPQEKPRHNGGLNGRNPEDKRKEMSPIDKKPTEHDKDTKLNEDNNPEMKNNSGILSPNTNDINKGDKDNKKLGLDKKKDFLLVGQGNNGHVFLLHENNPNPNQPGNNIMYVPYNPGQSNTPIYQVINGQLIPVPTNPQMTPNKIGVLNGYNNPGQNTGSTNPGYVTIYSNGQLMQIPGVLVNSAPNNVPIQNGNPVQGTNYIVANAVPNNNMQNVPTIQNPGTNVVYTTLPNQPSNGPIYVQMPNCMPAVSNGCGSGTVASNNGLPSNAVAYQPNQNTVTQPSAYPNGVSNSYAQPNMMANQGQGAIAVAVPNLNNQNGPYQPAVELPVNSGSNGYNQPMVSNQGQGYAPNQGAMLNNQNIPMQPAVQMPVANNNNGYNQPIVTSQRQEIPNQGGAMNNQNMPSQPGVEMPVNSGMNGYNQPMVSNQGQGPNVPNQGATVNNQNMPMQPADAIPITNGYGNPPVTNPIVESRGDMSNNQNMSPQPEGSVNSGSNGDNQPQIQNQGNQGTNAIVNTASNDVVSNQPENTQPLKTSSLVLDSNNLSSLGAQPAIMISDFKDKSGAKKNKKKSEDKNKSEDKKMSEVKKEEKDKGKKEKDKKTKDEDKPKVSVPFTNKKI